MTAKTGFSLWPRIEDKDSAIAAARQGFYTAICCSAATATLAILGAFGFQIYGFNLWNLTDTLLAGGLAFGIKRMSRTAAVITLLYYIAGRIDLWVEYQVANPIVAGFFVLMFLNSIRGTFAFHRFGRTARSSAMLPISTGDASQLAFSETAL